MILQSSGLCSLCRINYGRLASSVSVGARSYWELEADLLGTRGNWEPDAEYSSGEINQKLTTKYEELTNQYVMTPCAHKYTDSVGTCGTKEYQIYILQDSWGGVLGTQDQFGASRETYVDKKKKK